ncbi:MAG: hypothetical protein ACKV19_17950 [Verrucomicrobiales bacterium]
MKYLYSDPTVRQRMIEYLGGDTLTEATALYLGHLDGCAFQRAELHAPAELQWFLDRNLDIARSLADRESLLLHLDVEYVNFDSPAEAYVDPWRTFELQEPVVRVIEELLLDWGIQPLHLITGQGHHFVWRVGLRSEVARRMTALAPAPELAGPCMERRGTGYAAAISRDLHDGFSGTALLIEYLAHRIKWEAAPQSLLPVEITAVHVGPCATPRREMISIDISEYGDPMHTRLVRMPFTNYLKPWITGLADDLGLEGEMPWFRAIPLHEMDFRQAIKVRQDDDDVKDLARRANVRIPLEEEGTAHLLASYLRSPLRQFHKLYYSACHDPRELWPDTYDRTPLDLMPPCLRILLEWPNDRLLKPAGMQMLTRALLADGWHPRHVAGLIRSKFENPLHAWGDCWQEYEPGTRADFYTRLFAGQLATGLDRMVDFNCTSTQEKGFCPGALPDGCSLDGYRHRLTDSPPS